MGKCNHELYESFREKYIRLNEEYDKKLANLGCKAADFEKISKIICNNAYFCMNNEKIFLQ